MAEPWPVELKLENGGKLLSVLFDEGTRFQIAAELLRVESPSAEVKGHGPGQEQLVWGKRDVVIVGAVPVGNYAVRLKFSDGHDTGLFTWRYLFEMGRNQIETMKIYEAKLLAAGLRR